MSEYVPDPEHGPRPIDRQLVVGRLQEYGVPIEPEDLEGEDDEDVIGIIIGFTTAFDIDIDEILPQVTPVEKRRREEQGEPSEI